MNMEMERLPMEQLLPLLQLQMEGGAVGWLTVTGSSMHPTLRHGADRVGLVQELPRRGDVVLYRRQTGAYILHRIVRISHGAYLCAGDNEWKLERVAPGQVLGRVCLLERSGAQKPFTWGIGARLWCGFFFARKPILKIRRLCGAMRHKRRNGK